MSFHEKILYINIDLKLLTSFVAEPVVTPARKLMALEILSRFSLADELKIPLSSEIVYRFSSLENKFELFNLQLEKIESETHFFIKNDVLCTINVDYDIAGFICNTPSVKRILLTMPFVRLEISETFPGIGKPVTNHRLAKLSHNYGLWLDDFGAGNANLSALNSGLFETVKIDKAFFWEHGKGPLWDVIIRELRRSTTSIVIEGVETDSQMSMLRNSVEGLQGYYFPSVPLHNLQDRLDMYGIYDNKKIFPISNKH